MKKLTALFLCLMLCLTCVAVLASCDSGKKDEGTTKADVTTEAPAEETTKAPSEETTEAPKAEENTESEATTNAEENTAAEETTEAPAEETAEDATVDATEELTDELTEEATAEETNDPSEETTVSIDISVYDPEITIFIRNAEDLMAFNKSVNEDMEFYEGMTVVFLADIDMAGYIWTPLDGLSLMDMTFEGNNFTISNLQIADYEYEVGMAPPNGEKGCGFIGSACSDVTFLNLTFLNTKVTAYDQAVGNFLGSIRTGSAWFENCKSIGFTVDGWVDWNNQDRENGGHSISMRQAGFIGHIVGGGSATFENCSVEDITLAGFHNLAGFVGYDGGGMLDPFCFENCSVKNAKFTFSYCLSESYTVDMPRKFVSVFYNGGQWVDNIDDCVDMGNTYEGVYFFDYANGNAEYSPVDFRSWTQEEADAAA